MYRLSKTEQQYLKHQIQAHGGRSLMVCPICKAYMVKIQKSNKQLAKNTN